MVGRRGLEPRSPAANPSRGALRAIIRDTGSLAFCFGGLLPPSPRSGHRRRHMHHGLSEATRSQLAALLNDNDRSMSDGGTPRTRTSLSRLRGRCIAADACIPEEAKGFAARSSQLAARSSQLAARRSGALEGSGRARSPLPRLEAKNVVRTMDTHGGVEPLADRVAAGPPPRGAWFTRVVAAPAGIAPASSDRQSDIFLLDDGAVVAGKVAAGRGYRRSGFDQSCVRLPDLRWSYQNAVRSCSGRRKRWQGGTLGVDGKRKTPAERSRGPETDERDARRCQPVSPEGWSARS